jgi:hypothetical protein
MFVILAAAVSLSCAPLPGVEEIWADSKVRVVIFGEVHGTAEAPALFADAVCHAAQRGPVTVALEQSETIQGVIKAYVEGGSPFAREALVATPEWNGKFQDGRTSQAMLKLIDQLHALRAAGADVSVTAVMPARPSASQNYYEILMAAGWAEATRASPHVVLGLVGNLHARKGDVPLSPGPIRPAVAHLPADETLTLNIVGGGGSTWSCRAADDCKAQQVPIRPAAPRGITLNPPGDDAYDGAASTGGPWTASPPAAW